MSYTLFLYFTGFFVGTGMLLGTLLIWLAHRNRIATRRLLAPLDPRRQPSLLRPVALEVATPEQPSR